MQQASVMKGRSLQGAQPRVSKGCLLPVQSTRGKLAIACSSAKFFVGGNWKCNGTVTSVIKLVDELNHGSTPAGVDIVCAPPNLYLDYVITHLDKARYQVAAQNCWTGKGGAFTGEVAAEQLKDFGIPWVILGHSERRLLMGESNETVAKKTAYALSQGLGVIACIGETLEQREGGSMFKVLEGQMQALIDQVKDWSKVVIAYEPVWAIGTGVVATPEQAQEVHAWLRQYLVKKLGAGTANTLRIIYGGSVNDKNCLDLAKKEDIDGFLVGGASLQGPAFVTICNTVSAKKK